MNWYIAVIFWIVGIMAAGVAVLSAFTLQQVKAQSVELPKISLWHQITFFSASAVALVSIVLAIYFTVKMSTKKASDWKNQRQKKKISQPLLPPPQMAQRPEPVPRPPVQMAKRPEPVPRPPQMAQRPEPVPRPRAAAKQEPSIYTKPLLAVPVDPTSIPTEQYGQLQLRDHYVIPDRYREAGLPQYGLRRYIQQSD